MRAHHIFLAFVLQFVVSAAAIATTPLDDKKASFNGSQQCESYSLVPTQSQEGEQSGKKEEEEPDCE